MSKNVFSLMIIVLPLLFLSACGNDNTWENEEVTEVSDRILAEDVKVIWNLNGSSSKSTNIHLKIVNSEDKPIETFDITHEKLLHLIIISKDLSYFTHIHPEYKGNGIFEIQNDFPAGGEYRFIADFKPSNGSSMTKKEWLQVKGEKTNPAPIIIDQVLDKTVDGKRVQLSMDNLEANKEIILKFIISDTKTNFPVTDLQPYLGSIGHVVVLSEDGENYLHVHAIEDQGNGPDAQFETKFPKSGIYKVWGQFQKNNQVFTVSYVVNVP